jgi:hydroxymethylbilane synthase
MPAVLPDGLDVAAVLPREDPSDALILPRGIAMADLPPTARIGTGSVRRIAQLRSLFPAATFHNVRGNLDTRLRKLDGGDYDLLVLASAGLRRLGLTERISMSIPLERCVPAPGQGIIALETRTADARTRRAVDAVNDRETFAAFEAERSLVAGLGGGCQMPIGGIAQHLGENLELHAIVTSLDGARAIRYKKVGARSAATALGREVANSLLADGAAEILRDSRT